jgi:hypothetical protein
MRNWTKRGLFTFAAANIVAVVIGVGTATAIRSQNLATASASPTCTHYTNPYFTGDPNTQPQLCYQFASNPAADFYTTGVAIRTSNKISFLSGSHSWQLSYANSDSSYYCCQAVGNSNFGSIGGSNGASKEAECKNFASLSMYCTTLW